MLHLKGIDFPNGIFPTASWPTRPAQPPRCHRYVARCQKCWSLRRRATSTDHSSNGHDSGTDWPLGKLTVCYWKWWFIVDLPMKDRDFPQLQLSVYQRVWELPTIYKTYIRPIFEAYVGEYPQNIWPCMVQCLHFRILKFPLIVIPSALWP